MRHICLDTETTGFSPEKGDRIVEIACVEILNYLPTGREYHTYINPERDMPQGAFDVHGLSSEFLSNHPVFAKIVDDFLNFIGDLPLVIHNAKFDMKFLNAELAKCKKPILAWERAIDTLAIAKKKFPGSPATLDALCKKFKISLANRNLHGALIDTRLLAEVYLNLCEGRAPSFGLKNDDNKKKNIQLIHETVEYLNIRTEVLPERLTILEQEAHDLLMQKIKTTH